MLLKNNIKEIKSLVNSNNVLFSKEERYCYSVDASNIEKQASIPEAVVFVESIDEVQRIVKYANKHEIPIVSRGAGTNMVGACTCTKGGIVLNFSKMNNILNINSSNMTATVQPGVILGDLKSEAEKLGLFYPPDPSNYKVSTIGGSIAQSSGGAMSFKYGTTKDYVLSLKVVTAEGELMKLGVGTIKDATGYHLSQLMVGSEGTLAIIVEATLKLIPKPMHKNTIAAYFKTYENAIKTVNNIITSHVFPATIDFMDKNSMLTVEEFAKCGLKTEYECLLLIDVDGQSLDSQVEIIKKLALKNDSQAIKVADTESASEEIWQARRASYAATSRLAPDVLSDDIIVPREKLTEMLKFCNEISNKYSLKMCLVGHVGDGNIHPQIALNMDNEIEFGNYMNAKSAIYAKAIALGGTISAEHGIGLEKLSYLENTIDGKSIEYMKMIKRIFDPKNILNPDKIFKL